MGLVAAGLQSGGGGPAGSLGPGATGTTLVLSGASTALQFVSTQVSGSDGFKANTSGVRWHVGAGASDYFSSDGTTVTFAGPLATLSSASFGNASNTTSLNGFSAGGTSGEFLTFGGAATFVGSLQVKGTAQNGGAETAIVLGNGATLAVGQSLLQIRNGNSFSSAKAFEVGATGKLTLPTTDSSGTPGAATIDQPSGRSAIAAAASSVVITNNLVTAASLVFISPLVRDATGLLPAVTTTGAGSFTVTTSAACTATLTFNWFVLN